MHFREMDIDYKKTHLGCYRIKEMKKLWLSEGMISEVFWKALRSSYYSEKAENEAALIANVMAPWLIDSRVLLVR